MSGSYTLLCGSLGQGARLLGLCKNNMSSAGSVKGCLAAQMHMDPWVLKESVVPIYVQFSRDKYIIDGASEKLRRELEEELKQCGEEPRSHAWYHGGIPRQVLSHRYMHINEGWRLEKQSKCY